MKRLLPQRLRAVVEILLDIPGLGQGDPLRSVLAARNAQCACSPLLVIIAIK